MKAAEEVRVLKGRSDSKVGSGRPTSKPKLAASNLNLLNEIQYIPQRA